MIVPPGSVVGILGSGQLGRMFALAARRPSYYPGGADGAPREDALVMRLPLDT